MQIGKKLSLVLGGCIVLLTMMCAAGLYAIRALHATDATVRNEARLALLVARMGSDLSGIETNLVKQMLDTPDGSDCQARIVAFRKDYTALFDELRANNRSEDDRRVLEKQASAIAGRRDLYNRVLDFVHHRDFAAARKIYAQKNVPLSQQIDAGFAELTSLHSGRLDELSRESGEIEGRITFALIAFGLLAIALAWVSGTLLARSISKPLKVAVAVLADVTRGDVSRGVPEEYRTREDEIGLLARTIQTMSAGLRAMIHEISGGIKVLSSSSGELLTTSTQMDAGAHNSSGKAHSVAAAAEQMSSNIASVAAGMEHTTSNLAHIALATEQMTLTIGEIARNSEKARGITDEATRHAARISEQIGQLGVAAREIGKVTETITEISSQTNLLALNATIEAARAGAAGKGFAVVATEIKALAQQTAVATEDIKGRISGVQSATAAGIAGIGKISEVIGETSAIVASIAAAIEEQATTAKDIARNIAEASAGVNESNARVSETSMASREIARDILDVDHAAGDMVSGSEHVRATAGEISGVAESLRTTLGRFNA